jgi:hypothetical protein
LWPINYNLKPDVTVFGINTKHKETLSITAYELNKTDIGNSFVTEVISNGKTLQKGVLLVPTLIL